jgi:arylsulfatase
VVIVLADDLGFSDVGCYGSEIPTPAIDALAAAGVRFTDFHVTPLCSPTRAALLTGMNSHAVGMGMVANLDPGFPGYTAELADNQPTMAEVLRDNGYATLAVGKWHLCKEMDQSEAGDRNSWPLQRGFDQYYGFLEALTNLHHPHRLYEGNSVVQVDEYPEGYYLTDDLTDRAVRMIREVKAANPAKPFFLYYAHGAVHAPLHAKAEDIERHRGRYDGGWDRLREERLARQVELGVVPEGTTLPPRNTEPNEDVQTWDSLPEDDRRVMARYMEVYAAMVETIDDSVGRIRAELEALGELDNTIFVFTSDNGASREGRERGSISYFSHGGTGVVRSAEVDAELLAGLDAIGGPTTWPHYPRGWAMACNTPFRLYKITTFRGGHSVPFILSWPAAGHERLAAFRPQYAHVTDLLPTLAELIGIDIPTERDGRIAEELAGRSFAGALGDPEAPGVHTEQYYECIGHRGYYRDGWYAVTFHENQTPFSEDRWQLYHLEEDVNELVDLSGVFPEKLAELVDAWDEAAWRNRVYPLDEGTQFNRHFRPPHEEVFERPVRIVAGTPTLDGHRSRKLTAGRSFGVEIELDFRAGDEGVLLAHGDQGAGYLLFVEDDHLYFEINEAGRPRRLDPMRLPPGTRRITLDVEAPGGRIWNVVVAADGVAGISEVGLMQLMRWFPFEGIDVGIDRRSPVSWELFTRRGAFPYTGRLDAVTYVPGPLSPDAPQAMLEEMREIGLRLE